MRGVRLLDRTHQHQVVTILIAAFADDPLYAKVARTQEARRALATFLFKKAINQQERVSGYVDNDILMGVACVEKKHSKTNLKRMKPSFLWLCIRLFRHLSPGAFRFMTRYGRIIETGRKSPCHTLLWLAVMPENQGRGIGTALLDHVHQEAEADPKAVFVYLDTENERNLDYYKRFGYALTGDTLIDDVKVYCMRKPLRENQS
ncbi:MAG: N-acetyltransferase [Acholeplasmataceae bacterium]|nr:MAG: N-acetyltransferase [Acholeplasmataceae bacterium]